MAFEKAFFVMIFLGVIPFFKRVIIFIPASLAKRVRAAITAGMVPLPGSPIPIASVRQFMEFAVNIPAQEPHVGHALSSISASACTSILPDLTAPTPSNTLTRSTFLPLKFPASIGPPLTTTVGRFSLAAAISMPGTILSQFGTMTIASKAWAIAITSTESAINSRLASEYFIPTWFMAMPSQMPIVPNATGVPPAIRIPAFTAETILPSSTCPGMISLAEFAMPTRGLFSSSSVYPIDLNKER